MTKTVGLIRVSTDRQADKGVSLDAQKAKIEAYAELYDLELIGIHVDAGLSAKTMDRPGLQAALSDLKSGKADALLVVKLDRLTRSVKDLGYLVETYFSKNKWALMSVGEQIDTRSAAGRLVLNVLASVAQWEREVTGERTSAAMQHMRTNHEYTGGRVRFGYTLGMDGKTLHLYPKEQEAIQLAQDLRSRGRSLRAIGRILAARGYPARQGQWHAKTIRDLLQAA